jgi:hypothetical protein
MAAMQGKEKAEEIVGEKNDSRNHEWYLKW